MIAARLISELRDMTGVMLPLAALIEAPTIAALAALCDQNRAESSVCKLLRGSREQPAIFIVHGIGGNIFELRELAQRLSGCRVYAIHALGLDPRCEPQTNIGDMAASYLRDMRKTQPKGPYTLCGWSFGGLVAYEMARRLIEDGEEAALIMLDTTVADTYLPPSPRRSLIERVRVDVRWRLLRHIGVIRQLSPAAVLPYLHSRLTKRLSRFLKKLKGSSLPPTLQGVLDGAMIAFENYDPPPFPVHLDFIGVAVRNPHEPDPLPLWTSRTSGDIKVHRVPGDHLGLVEIPTVDFVAHKIETIMGCARGRHGDRNPRMRALMSTAIFWSRKTPLLDSSAHR